MSEDTFTSDNSDSNIPDSNNLNPKPEFYNYKYTLKDFNSIFDKAFVPFSTFRIIFNNIENGENNTLTGIKIYAKDKTSECEKSEILYKSMTQTIEHCDCPEGCTSIPSLYIKGASHMCSDFFNKLGISFPDVIPLYKIQINMFPLLKEIIYLPGKYEAISDDILYLIDTIREDISFTKVINYLVNEGKVKVRYTEHEYRSDCRNITWIDGFPLDREESVDSLGLNKCLEDMEKHLFKLAGIDEK